jgi:hypothetical protein
MKIKLSAFLIILLLILCLSAMSWAQDKCRSSGLKSASAAIMTRSGTFCGVEIITDGTNAGTVTVYDNATTNSGTELFTGTLAGANYFGGGFVYTPVSSGIYVVLSGDGAQYIVYYQ